MSEATPPAVPAPAPGPPPVPTTAAPQPAAVAPPPVYAAPRARRGRGFGGTSFTLGLLAVLGDLFVVGFVIATIVTFSTDVDAALAMALLGIVIVVIVFWAGLLFALISLILGIVGLVRGSGRVLAVFGILFSLGVAAVNLSIGSGIVFGGLGIPDELPIPGF